MTIPVLTPAVVVDQRGRFSKWYWMTLGGLLTLVAVVFMGASVVSVLGTGSQVQRYTRCLVLRAVAGVEQPDEGAPCYPPTEEEKVAVASATAANAAQGFLTEVDCRTRRALNNFPPPAPGESCVLPAPGESPAVVTPATTTTTAPSSTTTTQPSAPARPSVRARPAAPTRSAPLVAPMANPFRSPATLPALPSVTLPAVSLPLP